METQTEGTTFAEEDRTLWVLGELVMYRVASEDSGGSTSLFEVVVQPQGGPPPHIQHREDEWTYVLEGEFELLSNGRTMSCGPGSLLYVPKGNLHTYKNVGQVPGRLLVGQTPGEPSRPSSRKSARKRSTRAPHRLWTARPMWRGSWRSRPATASRYRLLQRLRFFDLAFDPKVGPALHFDCGYGYEAAAKAYGANDYSVDGDVSFGIVFT